MRQELLTALQANHSLVITIEDGKVMGSYRQNIAAFYGDTEESVKALY